MMQLLTYLQLWNHLVNNVLHGAVSTQAGEWMSFVHCGAADWTLGIALQVFNYTSFTNYNKKVTCQSWGENDILHVWRHSVMVVASTKYPAHSRQVIYWFTSHILTTV